MKRELNKTRIELNTDDDMRAVDFKRGTICAVCGQTINKPAALWIVVNPLDFFLHTECEPSFTPEFVKRHLGDMVLVMQDESLHDTPTERN